MTEEEIEAELDAIPAPAPELDPFLTIGAIGKALGEDRTVTDAVLVGRLVERALLAAATGDEAAPLSRIVLRHEILSTISNLPAASLSASPTRVELHDAAAVVLKAQRSTTSRSLVALAASSVVLRQRVERLRRQVAELEAEVADLRPIAARALEAEIGKIDWRTER